MSRSDQDKNIVAEKCFKKALSLSELSQYKEAETKFMEALAEGYDEIIVRKALGRMHMTSGDYKRAIFEFEKIIAISPDHAEAYAELGRIYDKQNELESAISNVKKAIDLGYNNIDIYKDQARLYSSCKNYKTAKIILENALKLFPDSADLYLFIGDVLDRMGDFDSASKNINVALEKGFENDQASEEHAHILLGRIHFAKGELKESLMEFEKALELNLENGDTYAEIGRVYERMGQYDIAVEQLQKACKAGYIDASIYNDIGRILCELGRYDEAIIEIQNALSESTEDGEYYLSLGNVYERQGEYKKAELHLKKALEVSFRADRLKQNSEHAHKVLGRIYFSGSDFTRAYQEFTMALEFDPESAELLAELGRVKEREGNFIEAIALLKSSLEKESIGEDIYKDLGRIYAEIKDYDNASFYMKQGLKKYENSLDLHISYGRILHAAGDYDLAVDEFNKAAAISADGEIYAELAGVYEHKGDYGSAIINIELALEKGADALRMNRDLGRLYCETKNFPKAIAHLNQALHADSGDLDTHMQLGIVYEQIQEYDKALDEFKIVLSKTDDDLDVYINIARVYSSQDDYQSSKKMLEEALKKYPDNGRLHAELSIISEALRDIVSSIEHLEKAAAAGGEDERIRIRLGEIYRDSGDYDKSVKQFERALQISKYKDEKWFQNRILNEIELSEKKVILKSVPRALGVVVTGRCNLNCVMCGMETMKKLNIPDSLLDEIIDMLPYMEYVLWHGGEVFLADRFEETFDKACRYPHLKQTIVTNGLLIDENWAKKFSKANLNLNISIDGFSKEAYERVRRGAKFEKLLSNIELINKYKEKSSGLMTSFRFTIMKSNYNELEKISEFAKKYKFDDFTIIYVHHCDSAENVFLHKNQDAKKFLDRILPEIKAAAINDGIVFHSRLTPIEAYKETSETDGTEGNSAQEQFVEEVKTAFQPINCYWPWQHLFVDITGGIKPSCRCIKNIGDAFSGEKLIEIWNNKGMQEYRKKIIENDFHMFCNKEMPEDECLRSPISGGPGGLLW